MKLSLRSSRLLCTLSLVGLAVLSACGGGGDEVAAPAPPAAPSAPSSEASVSSQMVSQLPVNTACPQADNQALVYAGVECLVVRTFGSRSAGGSDKLVVFLHGDVSAGGAADYMDNYAPTYAAPGVISVRMLRPGYFDSTGAMSSGSNGDRTNTYTARNVQAVANALAVLRQHHHTNRLVVVGHSGGAAIAATIMGRYPGLIDSVALVACPCDLRSWRPAWTQSLSPMEWVGGVPVSTPVVAMTGTSDTQVPALYSSTYVQALTQRGVPAQQLAIPGATHSSATLFTDPVVQAQIRALIP